MDATVCFNTMKPSTFYRRSSVVLCQQSSGFVSTPPLPSPKIGHDTSEALGQRSLPNAAFRVADAVKFVANNWKEFLDFNFWAVEDFRKLIEVVNDLEKHMIQLSDEMLQAKTTEFRERIRAGESLEDLQTEAFAVVREAARRTLGLRHFDVQLIGGAVLHAGAVAEMQTGEGKTLVSTLAAYLNALEGKGVHVITVNDYLAMRDSQWMGRVHRFLGLTVGVIQQDMDKAGRKAAYACDITYTNNSMLGFDYLRDNLAMHIDEQVMRWPHPFNYAIIDEIDSVIIDDGKMPLIIAQQSKGVLDPRKCKVVASAVERLKKNNLYQVLYRVDVQKKEVELTRFGAEEAWKYLLGCGWPKQAEEDDIWAAGASAYLKNALYVVEFLTEGRDYFVLDGKVKLIDPVSGRLSDRSWSGGIHQAVEAKELCRRFGEEEQELQITMVNHEAARITWRELANMYPKLGGMTGTARSEKAEFMSSLGMLVVTVPCNQPRRRLDYDPVVYDSMDTKWQVVATTTLELNKQGRPVLVGTSSVNESEHLSNLLKTLGVSHNVLNARPENARREAAIVAQAGRLRAVTIATNMAGRGTDILLGGNPEMMAKEALLERIRAHIGGLNLAISDSESGGDPAPLTGALAFSPSTQGAIARCQVLWALSGIPVDSAEAADMLQELMAMAAQLSREEVRQLAGSVRSQKQGIFSALERRIAGAGLQSLAQARQLGEQMKPQLVLTLALMLEECAALCQLEGQTVRQLGGLHVMATELQESRRLDDQLLGRAGRQGDPGSTETIASAEDRLFQELALDLSSLAREGLTFPHLSHLQSMWAGRLREARGNQKYELVMEAQRKHVYSLRQYVLESSGPQVDRLGQMFVQTQIHEILARHCPADKGTDSWDLEKVFAEISTICGVQEGGKGPRIRLTVDSMRAAMAVDGKDKIPGGSAPEASKWGFLEQGKGIWRSAKYGKQVEGLRDCLLFAAMERHNSAFGLANKQNRAEIKRLCVLNHLDLNWRIQMRKSLRLWEASLLRGFGDVNIEEEFRIAVSTSFLNMLKTVVRSVVCQVLNPEVEILGENY